MSAINPAANSFYIPVFSSPAFSVSSGTAASSSATDPVSSQDIAELSLTGRIALGVGDGKLTSDQAQQLTAQLNSINETIQSGGTGVQQAQSQLSQAIYGDTHNGATIPAGLKPSIEEAREFVQAGRIVTQESAGNITHSQAAQLFGQIKQIYQQSQDGASASAINQAQNQLSVEIYDTAHNITPPTAA
jgi:hypothetical protein